MPTYSGTAGNDSVMGSAGADNVYGYGGNDQLFGGNGSDTVDGGIGDDVVIDNDGSQPDQYTDYLFGGDGNDVVVGGYGDQFNGGIGYDVAVIWLQYATTGYVIDLSPIWSGLNQSIGSTNFTGMEAVDTVLGTNYNDDIYVSSPVGATVFVSGYGGSDYLIGGAGNDYLDAYLYQGSANDVHFDLLDGGAGDDWLTLGMGDYGDGGANVDKLTFDASMSASAVSINFTTLVMTGSDFILGAELHNFEHVAGVYGSDFADVIDASAETGGTEMYGQGGADNLSSGAGNDFINGGAGADLMYGGAGDDTYIVDDSTDKVYEYAGEGNDEVGSLVSYSIAGQYIETLRLIGTASINGTGNNLANTLIGNDGNNVLNGAGGADVMQGGLGNDRYIVDSAGDLISEAMDGGIDRVDSAVSYTLGAPLETLFLTGNATIHGTGNALANTIIGNSAGNIIDGGTGADRMEGNAGNDRYIVDNVGDVVIEVANEGVDTVDSSISYSLAGQYVETLRLTGTAAINGSGNNQANDLIGNASNNHLDGLGGDDGIQGGAGNDVLDGGAGRDTLVGGANSDWFVFDDGDTGATQATADLITDFRQAESDRIDLSGVDAIVGTGDNGFTYIGASAFTGVAGELRYEAAGTTTMVYGDMNGDSVADLAIALNGSISLSLGDFIL